MGTVHVRYFAICRERTGLTDESVAIAEGATVRSLIGALLARHPALEGLPRICRFAVNEEFRPLETVLADGDTVAMIPPVAGGAPERFAISESPLSSDVVRAVVERAEAGAVVIFEGVVRNHSKGRAVRYLEYEAYSTMALKKLAQIADEIDERWPGTSTAIHHRVGHLEVGERAVVIAVSSAHRAAAFDACEYAIDRIKEILPVWKKEVTPEGDYWVGAGS
ncbi:MAG: molybdopterin converting factor subunit 1 [Myxococcales bacterium]|nr:molybdopterin converting factor subunit 1 [Myxococcales bacterium]